ncbi:hypothetical protein FPQ18DRAFT_305254 [Pyronema domesticum]|uniref:Uncharacterized protein n=1 Tax=Pyronema omphalodes (strain CBS 100304) TaxID=1076935 RepID=U4LDU8_PYROM|nr:hypothetical protein FPQ18DRAFT_305254 [Pyronema domesticum]CCX12876.1 Protein of unknown function [Pyronema omphalodes CBS 100304]
MSHPEFPNAKHPDFITQEDFDRYIRSHHVEMDENPSELMYSHWLQGRSLEEAAGLRGNNALRAMLQRRERQMRQREREMIQIRALVRRAQKRLLRLRSYMAAMEREMGRLDRTRRNAEATLASLEGGQEDAGQGEAEQEEAEQQENSNGSG